MDNSNLEFLPLGNTKTRALPANCVSLNISATNKQLSFSKETSNMLRDGQYNFLKVGINKYSSEVYLIFCKKSEPQTMALGFGNKGRISVSVGFLVDALIEKLSLKNESQRLKLSENLSNSSDYVTYKISKW